VVQVIVYHEADAFANLGHARRLHDVMYMYLYMRMYEGRGCRLVHSRTDGKGECACQLLGGGEGVCNFFGAIYGVEDGYCWAPDNDEAEFACMGCRDCTSRENGWVSPDPCE